jgi:hypothetical protein
VFQNQGLNRAQASLLDKAIGSKDFENARRINEEIMEEEKQNEMERAQDAIKRHRMAAKVRKCNAPPVIDLFRYF